MFNEALKIKEQHMAEPRIHLQSFVCTNEGKYACAAYSTIQAKQPAGMHDHFSYQYELLDINGGISAWSRYLMNKIHTTSAVLCTGPLPGCAAAFRRKRTLRCRLPFSVIKVTCLRLFSRPPSRTRSRETP